MKSIRKSDFLEKDIIKYIDGYWITWYCKSQEKRIKSRGPYDTRMDALNDLEIINGIERK